MSQDSAASPDSDVADDIEASDLAHTDPHASADADVDRAIDAALDQVDDGDADVREAPPVSGELPLLLSGRERFSSLVAVPTTGDARVDAGTARLAEIPDLPTSDHVAVYDDVHRRLQDALADADTH